MREAYRLQKNSITETLKEQGKFMAVFFIYTGNEIPGYQDVFEKMGSALKRLNKIANEVSASNT